MAEESDGPELSKLSELKNSQYLNFVYKNLVNNFLLSLILDRFIGSDITFNFTIFVITEIRIDSFTLYVYWLNISSIVSLKAFFITCPYGKLFAIFDE